MKSLFCGILVLAFAICVCDGYLRTGRIYSPGNMLLQDVSRMRRDVFDSAEAKKMLRNIKFMVSLRNLKRKSKKVNNSNKNTAVKRNVSLKFNNDKISKA